MSHCPAARALDLYDLVVGLAQQTTARTAANRLHQGCTLEKPRRVDAVAGWPGCGRTRSCGRSEEHTSELQSLMRISYAVFCLKKKKKKEQQRKTRRKNNLKQ